jgi:hypothetical protein
MISLVFLICTLDECRTISPPDVFSEVAQCEDAAARTVEENQAKVKTGQLPEHGVLYVCYPWGDPA